MQQGTKSPDLPQDRAEKTATIQSEVNAVIDIMQDNIEKAVKRGENLESLHSKTQNLEAGAFKFKKGATKLQHNMDFKLKLIIGIIVIGAIGVLSYVILTTR
ncbi:hypothetical protein HK100_010189 [Physocladia obscura]|uniref:V-SNARE coiled-coil homology domain-containing protein n=1 Tax=Physocladia obscura TaxID=109957 RepID=A0AAD5T5F9_9FUNG|nr:hypothetical protein HK100_010189 [Physocladia obscura]